MKTRSNSVDSDGATLRLVYDVRCQMIRRQSQLADTWLLFTTSTDNNDIFTPNVESENESESYLVETGCPRNSRCTLTFALQQPPICFSRKSDEPLGANLSSSRESVEPSIKHQLPHGLMKLACEQR